MMSLVDQHTIFFTPALIFLLLFGTIAEGATIKVPDGQPAIQAGINSAVDGDTVLVAPDTASCALFISGEDSSTVLQGFTLTGGTGTRRVDERGAGTYIEGGESSSLSPHRLSETISSPVTKRSGDRAASRALGAVE